MISSCLTMVPLLFLIGRIWGIQVTFLQFIFLFRVWRRDGRCISFIFIRHDPAQIHKSPVQDSVQVFD